MMKRTLVWGLLAAAAMMVMTGCASSGKGNTGAENGKSAEAGASAEAGGGTEAGSGAENGGGASAGGAKSSQAAAGKKEGNLIVWIPGTGDASYDEAWNHVLKSYAEENPGVTYELTFIPWGEYFTKLNAAFSGGVGPDVFGVGYGQLGALQHNGNLLALNDYIHREWDGWTDIPENILSQGMKDGDTYGLLMPDVRTMFYRMDIAEEKGVTKDDLRFSSIEELAELAKKMTVYDSKGNVEVAGLEVRTSGAVSCEQNFFIFSSWFGGERLWNEDLTADFANEANVKALDAMKDMLDSGVAVLNETGDGSSQIVNGIAAMSINIESTLAAAKLAYPGQVAAVAFDMNTLTLGTFYSVNAHSKNPELAADLLSYVFDPAAQKEFAQVMGQTPSRSSLADWFVEQDSSGDNREIIEMYSHAVNYSDTLNYKFLDLMSLLRASIEDVLYNKSDSKTVLEDCTNQYNALLQ